MSDSVKTPTECPLCGAPVSSSAEDYYCAELCGWSQMRSKSLSPDPWIAQFEPEEDDA